MVIFDVISLFTSIPIKLATQTFEQHINNNQVLASTSHLSSGLLMSLIELFLKSIYLVFHGTIHPST